MDGSGISHEVCARHRIPREELVWQHVALHPVAGCTGRDKVARRMRPTTRYRIDVVECRFNRFESMSAVDTSPATVAHRGALKGALGVTGNP
jgi:hypothetical protein